MTLSSALDAVRELSYEDRLQLIHVMLDDIAGNNRHETIEFTDAEKAELDRRIAEVDANPEAGVPFEEAWARARARHGR